MNKHVYFASNLQINSISCSIQEHFTGILPIHCLLTTYNNVQGLHLNHDGRMEMLDHISPNCFPLVTLVSLNISPN